MTANSDLFGKILLIGPGGERRTAEVLGQVRHWSEGGFSRRVCKLQLRAEGFQLESAAWDFFEAFCGIREQLALAGFFPFCYGGSRSVYPSGLLRDMSLGLEAYRIEKGKKVGPQDIVRMFDNGSDVDVATVEEQRDYWTTAIKREA